MTVAAIPDPELLASALRVPGRLVIAPDATTGAFPYGGTPIGVRRDVEVPWLTEYQDVRDPMSGALLKRIRRSIEIPVVRFLLEVPWDQNVLSAGLNVTAAASSLTYAQPPEQQIQASVVPVAVVSVLGGNATPKALALVSDDPRLPSVYFLMVIPKIVADVTHFHPRKIASLVVDFEPIPTVDTGDPLYPYVGVKPWVQIGRWENMVL